MSKWLNSQNSALGDSTENIRDHLFTWAGDDFLSVRRKGKRFSSEKKENFIEQGQKQF
jgi:hypothetical protein